MYSFRNDYSELAHPLIIERINRNKISQNKGYGLDIHSNNAASLIKKHLTNEVDIHFLIGGTSCNKIVISHILKPYEAVISVASAHIYVHETGAIEANGHKIIAVPGKTGKITPQEIEEVCRSHNNEHMVYPKMVFISNTTEIGSIYTKSELQEIYNITQKRGLYLYLDGARIGVALTANDNDLTLQDIAQYTDLFYIGGTKNGALLGEALVIKNQQLQTNFRYSIKQNGGMLAKGYLIGLQFETLFTNNLFFELAKHANDTAQYLKTGLKKLKIDFYSNSPTNQQFIILNNEVEKKLSVNYDYEIWETLENKTVIRLVTSWATEYEAIDIFLQNLALINGEDYE